MKYTRRSIWLMILSGYAILSMTLLFAEELFSSGEASTNPGIFEEFFRSGTAWVLGPSLNLIWRAPLYVLFYVIGTIVCLALVSKMLSAGGWFARFGFGAALMLSWSGCGVVAYGPSI
jgi:hypothetical protein